MNSAATRHSPTCYKRGRKKKKIRDKTRISKRKEKSFATLFFFSLPFCQIRFLRREKTAKGRATHEQVHEAQVFNVGFFFFGVFRMEKKKKRTPVYITLPRRNNSNSKGTFSTWGLFAASIAF